MPAILSTEMVKRALADPELAGSLVALVTRKSKSKGKKTKIKGGTLAGIIIGVIILIIIICIILYLVRRRKQQQSKKQIGHTEQQYPLAGGH